MSNITVALDKFSRAKQSVKEHIDDNKKVFGDHEKLVGALIDAESELRDAAAELEEGIPVAGGVVASNNDFRILVTPQTQTFVDPEELKAIVENSAAPIGDKAAILSTIHVNKRPPRISIQEIK